MNTKNTKALLLATILTCICQVYSVSAENGLKALVGGRLIDGFGHHPLPGDVFIPLFACFRVKFIDLGKYFLVL